MGTPQRRLASTFVCRIVSEHGKGRNGRRSVKIKSTAKTASLSACSVRKFITSSALRTADQFLAAQEEERLCLRRLERFRGG